MNKETDNIELHREAYLAVGRAYYELCLGSITALRIGNDKFITARNLCSEILTDIERTIEVLDKSENGSTQCPTCRHRPIEAKIYRDTVNCSRCGSPIGYILNGKTK